MAKRIINQTSFSGGEITPRLYGRTDVGKRAEGVETGTNAIVTPHGPIRRRNGTQFIAETKDSSAAIKLVRYQLTADLAYILEFGNTYIRFFRNSGQITESDLTITGITQANPGVVTSTAHGLSNGDHVYITGVVGMTEVNKSTIPYKVANKTANTFELNDVDDNNIDTSSFTAYSSGGTINRIYEITSPYTTAQVADIQYRTIGTTMYIVHPDVTPRKLVRTSDTSWTLSEVSFSPEPTYESGYAADTTMTPAATTGTGVNFTAGTATFLEADIGRQIINESSGEAGIASITSITSTTVAVCDIIEDFTDTNAIASGDWKFDLSPICDLEFNGIQKGEVINIRSEYAVGTLGDRFTITGVTAANPGVVTTSAAHGLVDGDKVVIDDIVGMTQLNGNTYTVNQLTTTTFELRDSTNTNVDTTNYTAYSSGGIVRRVFTGLAIDAFRAADVGRFILANGGVMKIVSVNSADDIDVEVLKSLNTSENTGNWSLEQPTWDATRKFPAAVGLFEQRLVFGSTDAQPQTIWLSEIGIYEGFGIGPDDEDSIEIDLVSNEVNNIKWIASGRDLVCGTSGGEVTINSTSSAGLSPSSIMQQPRTYYGSDTQQVANVKDEIIFIQASKRKIRTFRYDFNLDGYTGEDLTFLAEHITEGGIEELVYAQEPDTIVYAVTTNGDLIAGSYDRSKQILGWTKLDTDGDFENVQTITKDEEDQIWLVVERKINSTTKRYIELLETADGTDDTDSFSDSYLTLSTPITVSNITTADPAVVTATAHGLSNGDTVIIKDLVDPEAGDLDSTKTNMSSLNGCTFTVANKATNTFELTDADSSNVDTSGYNSYGSGGNAWDKVTAISGLDHLEGKTVQIRVDGATHPDETVSSGAITLDNAAGEVVIGLPYTTTIKTLNHEFDIGMGTMQGQRARWARPLLRVYQSVKPLINGEYLPARSTADNLDKATPLFSGILEYGPLDWASTTALTITTSDAMPLEVTGLSGTIEAGVK